MSLNLLDHVALAYQPVWGRQRELAAVRLRVRVLTPEQVDAAHLLGVLADLWTAESPALVVSFTDPALLRQALVTPPVPGLWLELPAVPPERVGDAQAMAQPALARGHHLVQAALLDPATPSVTPPLGARTPGRHQYLLRLTTEAQAQAVQALAAGQPGPWQIGHIYHGLHRRDLVLAALDQGQAWGVCDWPEAEVLSAHQRYGVPVDKRTLVRVQQALMRERAMDVIEGLIHEDAILTHRCLRLVNSPVFGTSREITTVRQALMLLGQRKLSAWMLELMPGASTDLDLRPVRLALVLRARLMQALMAAGAQNDLATEIYVTGLFSGLDRLLHEPLRAALRRVPLSEAITDALLRQSGPYFPYFETAKQLENFDSLTDLPPPGTGAGFGLEQVNRALLRTLAQWRNTL